MIQEENRPTRWLVVSDLDGTLLDHNTYSHAPVDPLLARLERQQVPVVLNSSKTRDEMLTLRRELGNRHPFIVENGSAIFIPQEYFPAAPDDAQRWQEYWVLEPGARRDALVGYLEQDGAVHGAPYLAFSRASPQEIVDATGLPLANARAAMARDYSEPLLWRGSAAEKAAFCARAHEAGLRTLEGGRFLHLLGKTDKGQATLALAALYRQHQPEDWRLLAAGDSPNDLDMLAVADVAVIVRGAHRAPPQLATTGQRRVIVTDAEGPAGWAETVANVIPAARHSDASTTQQ